MSDDMNPDYEFSLTEQIDLVDVLLARYADDRVGCMMLDALRQSIVVHQDTIIAEYHRQRAERDARVEIERRFVAEMRAANDQLTALQETLGVML